MKILNFFKCISFKVSILAWIFLSLLCVSASHLSAQPGPALQSRWAETKPTLDGNIKGSEWSDALKVSKTINLLNIQGQKAGSHRVTLYIKNDGKNLYMAGQLDGEEHDGTMAGFDINALVMDTFSLAFDNNNDGVLQSGEDKKSLSILDGIPYVKDAHQLSPAEKQQGKEDSAEPQNIQGTITYTSSSGGYYQFELAIPLNSGDPFDIRLQPGQTVHWNLFYIDKFSITMKDMEFGGWSGNDMENAQNWGSLRLADSQGSSTAPAAPAAVSKAGASKDIQVFAVIVNEKDLNEKSLQFIGSHYDIVFTSFPFKELTDQLKKNNPNVPVLLFTNPYFGFGDKFWSPSSESERKNTERTFSLKTNDNKIINYGGPTYSGMEFEQNVPLMDVTNSQWQAYFASQARKYVDLGGLDGLFLDTMTEDIAPFALAPGNKFPKGYSAKSWKDANYEFLRKLKQAFSGSDALIYFNGMTRPPGVTGRPPNQGMLDMLDGTSLESYGIYMAMDKNENIKRWYFQQTILKDLKAISEQGKEVLIEVTGDRDDDYTRLYALCSFLLVQNDKTYFYFTKMSHSGGLHWRPEWDTQLGQPLGSYQKLPNGIYSRDFSKGKVLVNPDNKAVTVQLSGQYRNWNGNRIGTSLSMPAFSGSLLLKN